MGPVRGQSLGSNILLKECFSIGLVFAVVITIYMLGTILNIMTIFCGTHRIILPFMSVDLINWNHCERVSYLYFRCIHGNCRIVCSRVSNGHLLRKHIAWLGSRYVIVRCQAVGWLSLKRGSVAFQGGIVLTYFTMHCIVIDRKIFNRWLCLGMQTIHISLLIAFTFVRVHWFNFWANACNVV